MFRLLTKLFAGTRSNGQDQTPTPASNLPPSGTHALTYGGLKLIVWPHGQDDPAATAFETRLLNWLQTDLGVQAASHAGTNTGYWTFVFAGHEVELAVIGQKHNTSAAVGQALDWMIRIEEPEPQAFVAVLEKHFVAGSLFKRKMPGGKTRVQFKSAQLLPHSSLAEQ